MNDALAGHAEGSATDRIWDIAIIGAGSAGMMAAYFAARRGAKVLLIEAAAELGGSMWVSTGQMSAAGTKLQKARGIVDTPDDHYADVMRISRGTAKPEIVRLAVDHAAATFDWLVDNGLEVEPEHPITGLGHEHYTIPRYYWAASGGLALKDVVVPLIEREAAEGRLTIKMKHNVTQLTTGADGAINGLIADTGDGTRETVRAHNVLLACGGYAANQEMYSALTGHPQYTKLPYAYSQGAGVTLGLSVGGHLVGQDHFFIGFGMILADENAPSEIVARAETYPERRLPWEIYVNERGQRFLREDMPSVDAREHALLDQPNFRYWIIFDEAILSQAPPIIAIWSEDQLRSAFSEGLFSFRKADSVAELAKAIDVDGGELERTVRAYNYGVKTGNDFIGRQHLPIGIGQGPFYAIRLQGGAITSSMGLEVDAQLRVTREDGTPIAGLYAAGEILGATQTMGKAACGGMMVTPALTFGRLLGESMIPIAASN